MAGPAAGEGRAGSSRLPGPEERSGGPLSFAEFQRFPPIPSPDFSNSAENFLGLAATPWKKAAFWLTSCLSETEIQLNPRPLCWLADSNKTERLAEAVMAVPKRKQSNSRTGKRRSHDRLTPKNLTVCRKCSATIPTHVVCPRCGYYNSRVVVPSKEEI